MLKINKLFRASNNVLVNFILRYKDKNEYNTYYNGKDKKVIQKDNETELSIFIPDNDGTEKIRIDAVKEFLENEQKEFEQWLERHPECKQYV